VAKNRLLKIAADEAGLEELKPLLAGPTAVAATSGDEVSLARALQEAFRPYKVVTLRGGLLAGQPISATDLGRLANLPSREVLLGRLAGGMVAPLSGMASVLAANLRNLVGVLNAVAEQRRQTEVAPPADLAPPAEPTEPVEQTTEQTEQTERTEQTDQVETEEAQQTEEADLVEQTDQVDQAEIEPTEQADQAEPTAPAGQAEQVEQAEEIGQPTTDKEIE
jgi:hypothetical protein